MTNPTPPSVSEAIGRMEMRCDFKSPQFHADLDVITAHLADLQRQLAGAQNEIAEMSSGIDQVMNTLHADVLAAKSQFDNVALDRKRLDWMALHPRGAEIVVDGKARPCVFWGVSAAPEWTLREAVDAAMAQDPAPEES